MEIDTDVEWLSDAGKAQCHLVEIGDSKKARLLERVQSKLVSCRSDEFWGLRSPEAKGRLEHST